MIKLSANILFSGVGMQERGINNTELFDLNVLSTSDIDKEAIVSYAAIHNGLTKEMIENYSKYPSREQMANDLKEMNIGYQPEKNKRYDWDKLAKRKGKEIEKYWLACKISNQKGDISKIRSLPYADLWTISFPCQSISVAGKMKGFSPDSGTRSSLLWDNIRLLKDSVNRGESPKYLMFENVKNLVGKKFIDDFNSLLEILDDLGFNSYWKILNACECGIPQNRERVFVICVRKDIDSQKFDFPTPFDNGIRLKNILEKDVEEKYYINTEKSNELIRQLINDGQLPKTTDMYGTTSICEVKHTSNTPICIGNTTPSGKSQCNAVYSPEGVSQTLCAGTHGYATGSILDNYRIRKLTPRETFVLMGLTIEDANKCMNVDQSNTALYKQSGNGVATNCVELLFEHLYKAQYDTSYTCTDEILYKNDIQSKDYVEDICIDDTQGFDGVRYYNGYVPTLRSQRSGLKVLEKN